jgi:hypothetical protein
MKPNESGPISESCLFFHEHKLHADESALYSIWAYQRKKLFISRNVDYGVGEGMPDVLTHVIVKVLKEYAPGEAHKYLAFAIKDWSALVVKDKDGRSRLVLYTPKYI